MTQISPWEALLSVLGARVESWEPSEVNPTDGHRNGQENVALGQRRLNGLDNGLQKNLPSVSLPCPLSQTPSPWKSWSCICHAQAACSLVDKVIFSVKYHDLYFTSEKTESQRGEIFFPGPHTYQLMKLGNKDSFWCQPNSMSFYHGKM